MCALVADSRCLQMFSTESGLRLVANFRSVPLFFGHFLNSVKIHEHATHACRRQERYVACNHLQMAVVRCHHPTFSPPTSSGHGKQRMCPQYIANTSNTSSRA